MFVAVSRTHPIFHHFVSEVLLSFITLVNCLKTSTRCWLGSVGVRLGESDDCFLCVLVVASVVVAARLLSEEVSLGDDVVQDPGVSRGMRSNALRRASR